MSVPFHSRGHFHTARYDRRTETLTEQTVPYEVAGPEDAGKEFVLRLPDEIVRRLAEQDP